MVGLQFYLAHLIVLVFGFSALTFLIIYILFKYSYTYWRKRGVKGPDPTFPEGNFRGVFTKRVHISEPTQKLYEQFKSDPFIGVYTLYKPVLVINDLDLIKHVLIKDFDHFNSHGVLENDEVDPLSSNLFSLSGERWRDMRSKLSPVFTVGKMKIMTEMMVEVQNKLIDYIDEQMMYSPVMDFKDVIGRYTMDIIGNCAFGIECDSFNNPECTFVKYAKESIAPSTFRTQITFLLSFLTPALLETLRLSTQAPSVIKFFTHLVRETVHYREENKVQRNDLLQLLIQLKNNELKADSGEMLKQSGRTFTLQDLTAQAFVFVIAGYETSSSAASYALYWLARQPELQTRARQEVRAVLADHGGRFTYEALQQLDYLTMIIEETLRLHPVLNNLFRNCIKDYKMPGSSLVVEKGTHIFIPVIGIHMDPDIYPEPDVFDPERFTKEEKAKRHKCAYMPFGDGPRICIGMRFAMLQVKLALAGVLAAYEVRPAAAEEGSAVAAPSIDLSGLITAPAHVFLRLRALHINTAHTYI